MASSKTSPKATRPSGVSWLFCGFLATVRQVRSLQLTTQKQAPAWSGSGDSAAKRLESFGPGWVGVPGLGKVWGPSRWRSLWCDQVGDLWLLWNERKWKRCVWIPICFRQCTDISLLMGVINFGTLTAAKVTMLTFRFAEFQETSRNWLLVWLKMDDLSNCKSYLPNRETPKMTRNTSNRENEEYQIVLWMTFGYPWISMGYSEVPSK